MTSRLAPLLAAAACGLAGCAQQDGAAHAQHRHSRAVTCDAASRLNSWPSGCWRPFAAASPFNQKLPEDVPIAPGGDRVVERLAGWGPPQNLVVGHPPENTSDFGHPVYFSKSTDPVYRVRCERFGGECPLRGRRIRIPARARPAAGSDGHLAVIDRHAGVEYDFWKVSSKPATGGTLVTGYAGMAKLRGAGLRSPATASQFALSAGQIRPQELARGRIDHALVMLIRCSSGRAVWPAAPSSTGAPCRRFGLSDEDAPDMGMRFRLDMTQSEIGALDVPSWRRTILTAMAQYGMYVEDTMSGHAAWGVGAESDRTYDALAGPSPWVRFGRSVDAPRYHDAYVLPLDGSVDWGARLRVVPSCLARGSCP